MRSLAAPLGFLGSAASLAFWSILPFLPFAGSTYVHAGNEPFYMVFAALSVVGILGSILLATAKTWATLFLGLAILPATGALFLPGMMLIVAVLLALSEPEPGARRLG